MTESAFLGEWWLPLHSGSRVKGTLLTGDTFVLRLHDALVNWTEDAPVFVPAIHGVCDKLGRVLLLDCWAESRSSLSTLAGFSSFSVRVGKVLIGHHPSTDVVPTFCAATFRASGLLAWLRHRAPTLDVEIAEDGSIVGWKFGQAVTVPLIEDTEFRVSARLGFEALDNVAAYEGQAIGQAAQLLVESRDGGARLDALLAAGTRLVRLAELLQYREIDLRIDGLTAKDAQTAESHHLRPLPRTKFERQAHSAVDALPAIPLPLLTDVWSSICAKWHVVLARDSLPYHRLAKGLGLSGTQVLEDQFLNVATAVAAWVEHGGGSGQTDPKLQFREVLDVGMELLGATWPDASAEIAKGLRHYLVHGNLKERPADMYADPAFLLGWTRRLTAALWAAVMKELGIPQTLIRSAPSRSSTLRYDIHRAGSPSATHPSRAK